MDLFGIITRTFLALTPVSQAATTTVTPPAVTAPAPVATKLSADAALAEVQKFYASIDRVTALFRQSVTYDTFGSTKTSDGSVYIQKPGKMRWDYVEKKGTKVTTKKSFISNGQYLYMVEHDNKQVVKKNLQNDLMPVAVSFLYGKGDLKAEFTPSIDTSGKYGSKEEIVLKLTPKKPSAQYKSLTLVVSPTDYHVTQSIIVDSSNNVNAFRFFTPDFKKEIKASWFEFDEKSVRDYRIINADDPKNSGGAMEPTMLEGPSGTTPAPAKTPTPIAPTPAPAKK
ncbi:MAG TPA: outer membrane lipoprotein carrier protein LolA [Kofleriaceae bacterium]|jgi:outer membrane lipoprotein carrier protein